MIFRSAPVTDSNGDPLTSPNGGGARARAIVVRGEVTDTDLISSGSGYKVPPQILFTRGYFVFRKDPLSVVKFTTFGIEPPKIDSPVGVQSSYKPSSKVALQLAGRCLILLLLLAQTLYLVMLAHQSTRLRNTMTVV